MGRFARSRGWRSSSPPANSSTGSWPGAIATRNALAKGHRKAAAPAARGREGQGSRRNEKPEAKAEGKTETRKRRGQKPRRRRNQRIEPAGPFVDKQLDKALEVIRAKLAEREGQGGLSRPRVQPPVRPNVPPIRDNLILLAIETTCDETAAAVLEGPRPPRIGVPRIRSSVVASQVGLHQRYGGVVPEIASRAHVRQILPMIDEALRRAGVSLADLGAVAVATRPGLVGALVVGLTAAKALALALEIPLIAVDHLEGHLYACQLAYPDREVYPVRGTGRLGRAHQPLPLPEPARVRVPGRHDRRRGGRSVRQGGQPARPGISRRSRDRASGPRRAIPTAFAFPRSFLHDERLHLEFLGPEDGGPLRTARPERTAGRRATSSEELVSDVAASFQEAVVDVIVAKTRQALTRTGMKRLGVGGGVAANSRLRQRLAEMAAELGVEVFIPPPGALHRQRGHGRNRAAQARRRPGRRASTSTSRPAWSGPDEAIVTKPRRARSSRPARTWSRMIAGRARALETTRCCASSACRRFRACSCVAGIDLA